MRFAYNILFVLFFWLSAPYYFWKMWRRGNWRAGLGQRFGRYSPELKTALGRERPPADFAERAFWPKYMEAYEDLLRHTSHKHAPWFVIPSDAKWFRNAAISAILVEALKSLNLKYPPPSFNPKGLNLSKEDAKAAAKKVAALAGAAKSAG